MNILFYANSKNGPSDRFRIHQFIPYLRNDFLIKLFIPTPGITWKPSIGRTTFLNKIGFWGGYRIGQYCRYLSIAHGISRNRLSGIDVALINRFVLPNPNFSLFEQMIIRNIAPRFVYDLDDALYANAYSEKTKKYLSLASHVMVGNSIIANYAKKYNSNVSLIPTVVDTDIYKIRCIADENNDKKITIGWIGSSQTLKECICEIKDVFLEIKDQINFEFLYICDESLDETWEGVFKSVKFIKWSPITEIDDLHMLDIGIMPLKDNEFQKGKCGCKLIQYMAVGIPTISSPVGANNDICLHGITGFLASNKQEWIDYIRCLCSNKSLRRRFGYNARKRVEEHYSINAVLPKIKNIFYSLEIRTE